MQENKCYLWCELLDIIIIIDIILMLSQDPSKTTDLGTNKKILYKQKKLNQATTVFNCQCGKVYLSFPALYLHSKSNHQIKLTSKMTPDVCRIQNIQGCQTITYFIQPRASTSSSSQTDQLNVSNEQIQRQNQDSLHQLTNEGISIYDAVELYLNDNSVLSISPLRVFILKSLLTYINDYHTQISGLKRYVNEISVNLLPLYFNLYVNLFLPKMNPMIVSYKQQICSELMELYQWIKKHQMTSLSCTYNPIQEK